MTWSAHAEELAIAAARLVVDEGMEYAQAKNKALRSLGRRMGRASEMPSNDMVEEQVRAHIELFHADTQPAELRALRELALDWLERLADFRPHLAGAVWRGTATRRSCVVIDLYCDDAKGAEIELINRGIHFDAGGTAGSGSQEAAPVLSFVTACPALGEPATVHLVVRDLDDLRGALKPDAQGRSWRGDVVALRRLLQSEPR
jgi:hypothetical protein